MSMFDRNQKNNPPQPAARPQQTAPQTPRGTVSAIGPKTVINGDITGSEDLVISGRVTGQISLPDHIVTIRRDGQVDADIVGKSIEVDGAVNGNLFGSEAVIVRSSGRVEGNLRAPRVTLEDGANFRGSIDMKPTSSSDQGSKGPKSDAKKGQDTPKAATA